MGCLNLRLILIYLHAFVIQEDVVQIVQEFRALVNEALLWGCEV